MNISGITQTFPENSGGKEGNIFQKQFTPYEITASEAKQEITQEQKHGYINFDEMIVECEASLDEIEESVRSKLGSHNHVKPISLTDIKNNGDTDRFVKEKLKETPYISLQFLDSVPESENKITGNDLVIQSKEYFENNKLKMFHSQKSQKSQCDKGLYCQGNHYWILF